MGNGCAHEGGVLLVCICVVIVLVVVGIALLVNSVGGLFDSHSAQLLAEARLEQERGEAKAAFERAKQDREHQQSVDWLREVEMYALTMKMFSSDKTTELCIAAALIGAMGAVLIVVGVEVYLRIKP